MSASPSTRIRIRVPRNTSLHVFQRRPLTSTGYLWISLVRAVFVQVVFLSSLFRACLPQLGSVPAAYVVA